MILVLSPLGEIAHEHVQQPAYPESLTGLRVHALENTKHNAAALLTHLLDRLSDESGVVSGVVHRKDFSSVPADVEMLDQLGADADLVLVGTAD